MIKKKIFVKNIRCRPDLYRKKCAAGQIFNEKRLITTKCAAGRIFGLSPDEYSVLLI